MIRHGVRVFLRVHEDHTVRVDDRYTFACQFLFVLAFAVSLIDGKHQYVRQKKHADSEKKRQPEVLIFPNNIHILSWPSNVHDKCLFSSVTD